MMEKNQFAELRAQILYGARNEREFATKKMYEALIGFCKAQVRKFKFKISAEDAEERASDILTDIILDKLISFDVDCAYQPWISRIIHNKLVDEFRSIKNTKEVMSLNSGRTDAYGVNYGFDIQDNVVLPDEKHDTEYMKDVLDELIQLVSPKYRQVLEAYYFQELSQKEIVALTGLPKSTIGVAVHRGVKELKELFRKKGYKF